MKIDELVVVLGLDPSNFTKGQKTALESARKLEKEMEGIGKRIELSTKKTIDFFAAIKTQALGLLGFGGAAAFLNHVVNLNLSMGNLANSTGESVHELSAWEGAVQAVTGNAGSASGTIRRLNRDLQTFLITGQGGDMMVSILNHLNVSAYKANGEVKTLTELMENIADAAEKMYPDKSKRSAFLSLAGIDDDTISLLIKSGPERRALLEDMRRASGMSKESAEAAAAYNVELVKLKSSAEGAGHAFVSAFGPAIAAALKILEMSFRVLGKLLPEILKGNIDLLGKGGGVGQSQINAARNKLESQFKGAGSSLRVKPGAFSGRESAGTIALANSIQAEFPGLRRFTAGDDAYHRGTSSKHAQGLALDFTLTDVAKAEAVSAQLRAKLQTMGVGAAVINEYANPSSRSTGGHIHVQFDSSEAAQKYFSGSGATMGAGPAAVNNSKTSSNTTTSTTHIANLNVILPNATDAQSVAQGLGPAIQRQAYAAQSNSALQG